MKQNLNNEPCEIYRWIYEDNGSIKYDVNIAALFICWVVTLLILFPKDFAAKLARGIIIIAIKDNFQFW